MDKHWGNQLRYPGFEQLGPGVNVLSSGKNSEKPYGGDARPRVKKNIFSKLKTERRTVYREQLDKLLEEIV